MIFSHVLYQLSYLASTIKNARADSRRGRDLAAKLESYRISASAPTRGLHVSDTVQRIDFRSKTPFSHSS
jgi:hypothetical protein